MTATMRAGVFTAPGKVAVADVPRPQPGPGEVRLRIDACGICGSDLHVVHGDFMPADGHVLGHEFTGRVDAVGEGVEGIEVGDRFAVEPLWSCGECDACRQGRDSICPQVTLSGIHRNGGFAESAIAPAHRLYPVPEDLPAELAALAEPTAVVVHGLRLCGFDPEQSTLVLGAGSIGLLTVLVADLYGCNDLRITARYPQQQELARELGAGAVLSGSAAEAEALAGQADAAFVVETVGGRAETLVQAGAALRPGGTVCVLGVFVESPQLAPLDLLLKEARLWWSNCYARATAEKTADFAEAIRLISAHRERFGRLISHRTDLEDFEQAMATAADKTSGSVKVMVRVPPS